MKHWWIMSPWHIVLLEQLIYLAHVSIYAFSFFPPTPSPARAQVHKHLCREEEMQVYFHPEQQWHPSPQTAVRQLVPSKQGSHPPQNHCLDRPGVTLNLQWGGCFCSSLISHQAWDCHLPWSSVTTAWSREIRTSWWKKMQLLIHQVTWRELGVNLHFTENLLFLYSIVLDLLLSVGFLGLKLPRKELNES